MSLTPLVSIIIPVYNGSNYLREAIDSALAQTYQNIEILVINDGSNDDGATEAIAQSYGNKIRYFSKPNGGVSTALNLGIKNMKGQYFSWLSHDDLYYPNKIERQMDFLTKLDNQEVMLFADFEVLNNETGIKESVLLDADMLALKPKYSILRGCINGITVLLPKKVIDQVGWFDEKLSYTQDYDYWMRVQDHIPAVHMSDILTTTRIHSNQDSHKTIAKQEADQLWLKIVKWLSNDDKIAYEGSLYVFFKEMLKFLQFTSYDKTKIFCQKALRSEQIKLESTLKTMKQPEVMATITYLIDEVDSCGKRMAEIAKENEILFERIINIDAENQRLARENKSLQRNRGFVKKIVSKIRRSR